MRKKLFILGLDCATPQLVFDRYLPDLPVISALIRGGNFGRMESTVPPVTVPAWMSMMTGRDPGQLGFYGFTDRSNHSYGDSHIITHNRVREKAIWDHLADHGYRSIVMNLPLTYPPRKINGIMISSFLTPDKELSYTYPEEIKHEIDEIADGDYLIDVSNFRTTNKRELLAEIYEITKKRFKVIRNFVENKEWDLFVAVEMGVDRLHHAFWSYCFSDHWLFREDNEFKNAIRDYYKYIDGELGRLLELFDDDTELMIVSDHGAKTLKGTFFINDWLLENGYLKMKGQCDGKTTLDVGEVDWERTTAWGSGGYYCKIYLNIKGREPKGTIDPSGIEEFKRRLIADLSGLKGPEGESITSEFHEPRDLYREVKGCPPDMFVYLGNLDWRVSGTIGNGSLFMKENTAIDNANHAVNGIFIHTAEPKARSNVDEGYSITDREIGQFSILDVAPTALNVFNLKVPDELGGKIIK